MKVLSLSDHTNIFSYGPINVHHKACLGEHSGKSDYGLTYIPSSSTNFHKLLRVDQYILKIFINLSEYSSVLSIGNGEDITLAYLKNYFSPPNPAPYDWFLLPCLNELLSSRQESLLPYNCKSSQWSTCLDSKMQL